MLDVGDGPLAIVNPTIVASSGKMRGEEGCLSIPEIFADVDRAALVTVEALSVEGDPITIEGTELLARCLQHEIDHLHGKLFLDYLSILKRRSALAKWDKLKADFPGNRRTLSAQEIAEHVEHADRPDEAL